ncbi:hypothetical protein SO802_018278 [Lithocarpus litseifolius]|uniref:Reverse transcriptase zinc-binding domain-containing protein n=1 Tax=Lithocarpus litseifolius TaxID=425828 RepID=A0AAW2CKE0_9ROSI
MESGYRREDSDLEGSLATMPITYKVQTPPNSLPENATVNLLIDQNTSCWKHEIIDAVFAPNEAQIMKSIPLSRRNHKDILIWNETTCGVFTVKSAYHMLRAAETCNTTGECLNPNNSQFLWKGIWEVKFPSRIKILIWKACCNRLPTRQNLYKRKMFNVLTCPLCQEEAVSVEHVTYSCEVAQAVWKMTPGPLEFLGLFNSKDDGLPANHILAIELDTLRNPELLDITKNYVGIDVNSMISVESAPALYIPNKEGKNISLDLLSGNPMHHWIDYNEAEKI